MTSMQRNSVSRPDTLMKKQLPVLVRCQVPGSAVSVTALQHPRDNNAMFLVRCGVLCGNYFTTDHPTGTQVIYEVMSYS